MTEQPPTDVPKPCRACGQAIPREAQACPHCQEEQAPHDGPDGGLRLLGGESTPRDGAPPPSRSPAPPPPAGPRPTSDRAEPARARPRHREGTFLAYVQEQWKEDPWFAGLLGLIALGAVLSLLTASWFNLCANLVVLWGLLTYNYWVYIIVVVLVGLSVLQGGLMLITAQTSLAGLFGLAVQTFIFVVLLRRYDHYT